MHILRCKTGPLDLEVHVEDFDILSFIEHTLPVGSVKAAPEATIRIHEKASCPQIHERASYDPTAIVYDLKNVTYVYYPHDSIYRVSVGNRARGLIDFKKSSAVWNMRRSIPAPRSAFHILVLDPLSLLLPSRGLQILHGAAVVSRQGATLLLGRSGSGKSSLGLLASHLNPDDEIRFLSDDTLFLDFTSDIVQVHPVHTGFGITSELLARLNIRDHNILQYGQGKAYLSHVPCQSQGPHKISRIIFLEKESAGPPSTKVTRLSREKTLLNLLDSQTTIGSPFLLERFNLLKRLTRQAPGISLRYAKYCNLDVLRTIVTED